MSNSPLDAALHYAAMGYPVFPCVPGEKRPATGRGCVDATTDQDVVRGWWSTNPRYNVAIATTGLLVIDIDGADNPWPSGAIQRADLEAPGVPCQRTPRGGWHYTFMQPAGAGLRNTASAIADKVDTRADGGYILTAPSTTLPGDYVWMSELPPRDQLPLAPQWMIEALQKKPADQPGRPVQVAGTIPEGQRNTTLYKRGCQMRRYGHSERSIYASLCVENIERCQPPLPDDEIEAIARSASKEDPDTTAVALAEDWAGQMWGDNPPLTKLTPARINPFLKSCLSSTELNDADLSVSYVVDEILVRDQPMIIGGPVKSLKTSLALDLVVSTASGKPFLCNYKVINTCRPMVISGESGLAIIRETSRRVCDSKHVELSDLPIVWSSRLPSLIDPSQRRQVIDAIEHHEIDLLLVDPLYMALMDGRTAAHSSNVMVMGQVFRDVIQDLVSVGCTPILCHHVSKSASRAAMANGECPTLEDLAQAGVAEAAGQWILTGRRSPYSDGSGYHELWIRHGCRAGDGGLIGLDIREGTRKDLGGRRWSVTVRPGAELMSERAESAEANKEAKRQESFERKLARAVEKIMSVCEKRKSPLAKTALRDLSGQSGVTYDEAIAALMDSGELVQRAYIDSGNRTQTGFILSKFVPDYEAAFSAENAKKGSEKPSSKKPVSRGKTRSKRRSKKAVG